MKKINEKEKYAIEFIEWLISQDGQDTIHDAIIFGEINKTPTPEELLEQFKNK
jgi:ABC-type Fe3+ transport system substrate-binding protein